MLAKIKYIIAALAIALGMAGAATLPVAAQAGNAKTDLCEGITAGGGSCNEDGAGLTKVVKTIIQILSLIAGIAAVIMIIVGGLRYITSGGDSSKIAGAKSAIMYAIIGLVIVALAQFIVRYVLSAAT